MLLWRGREDGGVLALVEDLRSAGVCRVFWFHCLALLVGAALPRGRWYIAVLVALSWGHCVLAGCLVGLTCALHASLLRSEEPDYWAKCCALAASCQSLHDTNIMW